MNSKGHDTHAIQPPLQTADKNFKGWKVKEIRMSCRLYKH